MSDEQILQILRTEYPDPVIEGSLKEMETADDATFDRKVNALLGVPKPGRRERIFEGVLMAIYLPLAAFFCLGMAALIAEGVYHLFFG